MNKKPQEIIIKTNPNIRLDRMILDGEYQHIDYIISITSNGQNLRFQFNISTRVLQFIGHYFIGLNVVGGYNVDSIKIRYYSNDIIDKPENSNYEEWYEE